MTSEQFLCKQVWLCHLLSVAQRLVRHVITSWRISRCHSS